METSSPLSSIQWQDIEARPDGTGDELLASSRQAILLFDMNTSQVKSEICAEKVSAVKRDPHNANLLVYVAGSELCVHDLRQKTKAMQHVENSPFL